MRRLGGDDEKREFSTRQSEKVGWGTIPSVLCERACLLSFHMCAIKSLAAGVTAARRSLFSLSIYDHHLFISADCNIQSQKSII